MAATGAEGGKAARREGGKTRTERRIARFWEPSSPYVFPICLGAVPALVISKASELSNSPST